MLPAQWGLVHGNHSVPSVQIVDRLVAQPVYLLLGVAERRVVARLQVEVGSHRGDDRVRSVDVE
jgi:hypothetical protein